MKIKKQSRPKVLKMGAISMETNYHESGYNADDDEIKLLFYKLKRLLFSRQNDVAKKWRRWLPFGDYISDRWERAKSLGFEERASIYDSSLVIGSVRVGKETWIGPNTVLDGSGGLTIGEFCSISAGVQIYTHDTVQWALSGGKVGPALSEVRIGNNCYVGPNTVISRGVSIGDGCVIGACSFVNIDVPAGSRAWGIPARIIS